jgi:hypothetical protein
MSKRATRSRGRNTVGKIRSQILVTPVTAHASLNNEAQLIDQKLAANGKHRTAMMELIASGESIAFVGAGLSVPLGYPGWTALLSVLEAEATALGEFTATDGPGLLRAQSAKVHFAKKGQISLYHSMLGREFGPRTVNCTDTHRRLVGLPFRAFVTTNYEDGVETALLQHSDDERRSASPTIIIKPGDEDRHRVSLFLRSLTEPRGQRLVGHLHGHHSDTRNIILAQDDYDAAYGSGQAGHKTTLHRHLVWALFATRRLIFTGCGMDDPPVRELLGLVATGLWETRTPMHYVILPLDRQSLDKAESTAAFFKKFGLQVVYYDNQKGDHSLLTTLFDETLVRVGARRTSVVGASAAAMIPPKPSPGPADLNWLDAVSERNVPDMKP